MKKIILILLFILIVLKGFSQIKISSLPRTGNPLDSALFIISNGQPPSIPYTNNSQSVSFKTLKDKIGATGSSYDSSFVYNIGRNDIYTRNLSANVGIGTTTPSTQFDIEKGKSSFLYQDGVLQIRKADNSLTDIDIGNASSAMGISVDDSIASDFGFVPYAAILNSDLQKPLILTVSGSQPDLSIVYNGVGSNVGINTITPSSTLDVNGTVNATTYKQSTYTNHVASWGASGILRDTVISSGGATTNIKYNQNTIRRVNGIDTSLHKFLAHPTAVVAKNNNLILAYDYNFLYGYTDGKAEIRISSDSGATFGTAFTPSNWYGSKRVTYTGRIGDSIFAFLTTAAYNHPLSYDSISKSLNGITWTKPTAVYPHFQTASQGEAAYFNGYWYKSIYNHTQDTLWVLKSLDLIHFTKILSVADSHWITEGAMCTSNGILQLYYRLELSGNGQIWKMISTDGSTWSSPVLTTNNCYGFFSLLSLGHSQIIASFRNSLNGTTFAASYDAGNTWTFQDINNLIKDGVFNYNQYGTFVDMGGGNIGWAQAQGTTGGDSCNVYWINIKDDLTGNIQIAGTSILNSDNYVICLNSGLRFQIDDKKSLTTIVGKAKVTDSLTIGSLSINKAPVIIFKDTIIPNNGTYTFPLLSTGFVQIQGKNDSIFGQTSWNLAGTPTLRGNDSLRITKTSSTGNFNLSTTVAGAFTITNTIGVKCDVTLVGNYHQNYKKIFPINPVAGFDCLLTPSSIVTDELGNTTGWTDQSSFHYNAIASGNLPIYNTSSFGGWPSVGFLSANRNFLSLGTQLGRPSSYTVFYVFKKNNNGNFALGGQETGSGMGAYGSEDIYFSDYSTDDIDAYYGNDTTACRSFTATSTVVSSTWYVIAIRHTDGIAGTDIFLNGSFVGHTETSSIASSIGTVFEYCIGKIGEFAGGYFDGEISAFIHYPIALSDANVLLNYTNYLKPEFPLLP